MIDEQPKLISIKYEIQHLAIEPTFILDYKRNEEGEIISKRKVRIPKIKLFFIAKVDESFKEELISNAAYITENGLIFYYSDGKLINTGTSENEFKLFKYLTLAYQLVEEK